MKVRRHLIFLFILPFFVSACQAQNAEDIVDQISLPEGFSISVYASEVDNARSLALGDQGTVFVGNRSEDKVYALVDMDGDYKADQKFIIAEGLEMPNGVAFYKGNLYVAEVDKVWKYPQIESQLQNPPSPILISDQFPSDRHHGWKYIAVGPDEKLYVPVGAPCNICEKEDSIYSTICRMNLDGSGLEVYAHGVRNSVGFDWHPLTNELWFTDNGRDMMGDNIPADELNRAPRKDMHFGYPYCHQGDIEDPEYGSIGVCGQYIPPVQKLGPHVAGLGVLIYQGDQFPKEYKNQVFIAEHGSWNRSTKIGYRISLVRLAEGYKTSKSYEVFAEGWLKENKEDVLGRPVSLLELPDGSVLLSDDYADLIYRISYSE
ncbi:MAG: sorbosone dehydrogenase family protein [Vicingaceae bacterium]